VLVRDALLNAGDTHESEHFIHRLLMVAFQDFVFTLR
jgi:hypothetical protein